MRILLILFIVGIGWAQKRQYFIESPSNVTVVQGDDTVVRCVVGHQAKEGGTHWTKDGAFMGYGTVFPGYPRYRVEGNHTGGEYHLRIYRAELEDDAGFECQVEPAPGDEVGLRHKAYVNVLVPPNNVTLEKGQRGNTIKLRLDSTVEVRTDHALDISCRSAPAKPAAQLRWYRNGHLLPDMHYKNEEIAEDMKRFTTISRLQWPATDRDNGAVFACEASHPAVRSSRPVRSQVALSVIYQPGTPVITGHEPGKIWTANDSVQLICMIDNIGNPPAQLIWYRNSVSVGRNYTYFQGNTARNVYEFVVQPVDNDAEYRCDASNAATHAPLSAIIRLRVYFGPERVHVSGPDQARIGDTVQYVCTSSASHPAAALEWFVDGQPYSNRSARSLAPLPVGNGVESVSEISVEVKHRRPQMAVVCRAINSGTRRETTNHRITRISYPPDSVKIEVRGGNRTFTAGEAITLICTAAGGNPPSLIEWYLKQHKVAEGIHVRYDKATISELSMTMAAHHNKEEIQCRAQNLASGVDHISATAMLHVHFPPESLQIKPTPGDFQEGVPAEITCESSSANPSPTVDFFRNGRVENSVTIFDKTAQNNGRVIKKKLTIVPSIQDHGKSIECRARSQIMASPISEAVTLNIQYKPIVAPIPQPDAATEGQSITLNCTAHGNPPVDQYTWHKDRTASNVLRSIPQRTNVNGHILEIMNIKRTDAGIYSCKAKNRIGESLTTATITVKYPAEIKRITPSMYVNPDENVSLICEVDAFPFTSNTVRWERTHGHDIPANRLVRTATNGSSKLTIYGVKREDTGEFTCWAYNGIGKEVSNTTLLLVKQSPVLDHSSVHTKAAAALTKSATLTCVADGIPEVKFFWHRDTGLPGLDRPFLSPSIYENDRINVTTIKIGFMRYKSEMRIRNVQESDYGYYRCTAKNDVGSGNVDVKFGRPERPDPPSDLRYVNRTHDSITLDWKPGFDGGLDQSFRVKYRVSGNGLKNAQEQWTILVSTTMPLTVYGLKSKATYEFSVQAENKQGHSEFTDLTVDTPGPDSIVQESVKDEFPVLIVVLVCLVGILLLVFNVGLLICFLRRHRRKKLQERAASARLGSSSAHKIQMYSADIGTSGKGVYQHDEKFAIGVPRSSSPNSDGEVSIRTVIEVDQGGAQNGFAIASGSPQTHAGYLLDDIIQDPDDVSNGTNYAEALRSNSLQRRLAGGVYNVPEATVRQANSLDRNKNTYIAAQAVDDILPSSAAGSSYPYYALGTGNRCPKSRYSPTHSAQLQGNNRTPYAEVRPLLSTSGPVDAIPAHGSPVRNMNRTNTGSPILTTFATLPLRTTMPEEYEDDADSLSGDLV